MRCFAVVAGGYGNLGKFAAALVAVVVFASLYVAQNGLIVFHLKSPFILFSTNSFTIVF